MKKYIQICSLIFFITVIGVSILTFSFMSIFVEFSLISNTKALLVSIIVSIIAGFVSVVSIIIYMKIKKKTILGNWLNTNAAKFSLLYILLILAFLSIKSELFWTLEEMKDVISLGWSIFDISVAIFLLWNVIAIDYLEKRKPQKPASSIPTKVSRYLQEKGNFYSNATFLLNNVNLLLVNLLSLAFVTVYVYITNREVTILSQSFVIIVLLLCVNTITGLILDILKPFNEKKKEMLQETKVTKDEVELQNKLNAEMDDTLKALEIIKNLNSIDDEKKDELIYEILKKYYDIDKKFDTD